MMRIKVKAQLLLSIVRLFKNNKLLTRDDRRVERKKISLVKARKRPQYSKR